MPYIGRQGGVQVHNFVNATDDDIMRVAPAVFSRTPDVSRVKERTYQHVATIDLLNAMREEGWQVTAVGQRYVKDERRWPFTKHFVRMRNPLHAALSDELFPEAIILNAHDGTGSWKYYDGAFRGVCMNGMVWGEIMGVLKVHHTLRQAGQMGAIAMSLSKEFMYALPSKLAVVDRFREQTLERAQVMEYLEAALKVRWPAPLRAPITTDELVKADWLDADRGMTAWQIFNHTQRHLVTLGGLQGATASGSVRMTRPITRVDDTVRINVGLWNAMVPFVKEKVVV